MEHPHADSSPPTPRPRVSRRLAALAVAGLAVATLVLGWPGLRGGWIYDDVLMATSPLMDDAADLLATPLRTSLDWFAPRQTAPLAQMSGFTWRPVTMASLVATNVLAPASPGAHHALGWFLHGVSIGLLAWAAARSRGPAAPALVAVAAFALHPALAEAWIWINGRSDVMAGVWLGALGVLVAGRDPDRCPGVAVLGAIGLFTLLGALSKETFLPASGVLVVAPWVPAGRTGWSALQTRWRSQVLPVTAVVGAWGAAVFTVLAGRAVVGRDAVAALGSGDGVGVLLERLPRLLVVCLESLLSPLPRSMRMLATALETSPSAGAWVCAAVAIGVVAALVATRNARALVLAFGAVVALVPTASVADYDWLGLDRYLYLPAMLCVFALVLAEPPAPGPAPLARAARVASVLLAGWAVTLALGLRATASAYRGPAEWAIAMIDTQPRDAAGYLVRARQLALQGQGERAVALLDSAPLEQPPAPIVHALAEVYLAAGRPDRAAAVLDAAGPRHPDHLFIQYDLMSLRMAQGRWDEAGVIADRLLQTPRACAATRDAWAAAAAHRAPDALGPLGGRHLADCAGPSAR